MVCRLLRIICLHLFVALLCGHWGLAFGNQCFGRFGDWGDKRVPRGLPGCLRVHVLSLGPVFHTCQSPTLRNCLGQVIHILGIKIALIFPLCTSVFTGSLFRPWKFWHSPEAFDCVDYSGLTSLIACWGDALSLSKFLASPDLSGSLLMGSGSNAAYPGRGGTSTSFVRGCVATGLEN